MALIKDSFCQYKQQRQPRQHRPEAPTAQTPHRDEWTQWFAFHSHSMMVTCEPFSQPTQRICLFLHADDCRTYHNNTCTRTLAISEIDFGASSKLLSFNLVRFVENPLADSRYWWANPLLEPTNKSLRCECTSIMLRANSTQWQCANGWVSQKKIN